VNADLVTFAEATQTNKGFKTVAETKVTNFLNSLLNSSGTE